eukprot:7850010-Pyramimonas_sp.AAC.1
MVRGTCSCSTPEHANHGPPASIVRLLFSRGLKHLGAMHAHIVAHNNHDNNNNNSSNSNNSNSNSNTSNHNHNHKNHTTIYKPLDAYTKNIQPT